MARLRRSDPSVPGITRRRAGSAWSYAGPDADAITDPLVIARCDALVLPPAWTDVWICTWPNGHIQAVGTDAAGRRQYRYHEDWRTRRDGEKFDRVLDFADLLPEFRRQVTADLDAPGMPRRRALAGAARLLDIGFFRVGGEQYAEQNKSYGLATIRREHVSLEDSPGGATVTFDYIAKSGKRRVRAIIDPAVVELVTILLDRDDPHPELLAYEVDGQWVDVSSRDINHYLKTTAGGAELSAKDFRTWSATVLAAVALAVSESAATSPTARKRAISRMYTEVSEYLGNTPAVCRASYVHPRIVDLFHGGQTIADDLEEIGVGAGLGQLSTHGPVEAAVLDILRNPRALRAAAGALRRERKAG